MNFGIVSVLLPRPAQKVVAPASLSKKSGPGFLRGPILYIARGVHPPVPPSTQCTSLKAGVTSATSGKDRSSANNSVVNRQNSIVRRRRNETMTLRQRSSRATTRPRQPYSCFVLERRNSAIMLPKLYIVPLDELLGIFHRGLIVGAHKSNCSADKTVFVHDVSSILGHIGVTPKSLRTTSIPSRLSGSGF